MTAERISLYYMFLAPSKKCRQMRIKAEPVPHHPTPSFEAQIVATAATQVHDVRKILLDSEINQRGYI